MREVSREARASGVKGSWVPAKAVKTRAGSRRPSASATTMSTPIARLTRESEVAERGRLERAHCLVELRFKWVSAQEVAEVLLVLSGLIKGACD
jgi:hypothetical protein